MRPAEPFYGPPDIRGCMPVTQVQIASIDAERYASPDEQHPQVRIDHNSTVTQVDQTGDDTATVGFRYTASYGNVGSIKLEGELVFQGDAESLSARWDQDGNMPNEIASEIHTAVMRACVTEAVGLAKDLSLPPPIPLPQVQVEDQQGGQAKGSAGSGGGPEIA